MKSSVFGCLLLFISIQTASANCPELPSHWFVKKVNFIYSDHTGNYEITTTFPDLKNLNCTPRSWGGIEFDLSATPVTITYKSKVWNRVTQTVQFKYLSISENGSVLSLDQPTIDFTLSGSPRVRTWDYNNGKYSYINIPLKVLSRW